MPSRRRVAVYRSSLLPRSETFVAEQARALTRWRPLLVGDLRARPSLALTGLESLTARRDDGVLVRRLARADSLLERGLGLSLATCAALARARPTLVHAHFGIDGVRVWPAARALGLPLLVTLHGFDIMTDEPHWRRASCWRHRAYPAALRRLAREPRVRFVAVSDAIRARALGFGLAADKVETAYIGVDLRAFTPRGKPLAARARDVLFVGRLVEKKGTAHLIDAFSKVHARLPDARLVICGDGPLRESLQRAIAARGLPARVLGEVPHEHVRALLESARVLCLPSVIADSGDGEGLPIVLLEAQASGVPVVTSAQGGDGEGMLHGETGLAFAPGDVDALAQHLLAVLTDDALCTRLGAGARAHVECHFDLAACTHALEAIYDRAAARA